MSTRIISFAQNAEDIVLRRALGAEPGGFYIDVGANHPVNDSVTKLFYDAGWRGINIEPQASLHRRLEDMRPRDVNLNVGVSDAPGELTLTEIVGGDGLATFDPTLTGMYEGMGRETVEVTVPVVTLASICEEHVSVEIDFLKIDVEGHEASVLSGADFDRFRPRVIVIEATFPERWEHLLDAARYRFAMFDGINRFYVREEDVESLEPTLRSPATLALDGYDPYLYVAQLEHLAAELERMRARRPLAGVRRRAGRVLRRLGLRRPPS